MSTDSAISIAWDVLKCLVAPLKRAFSYVMSSKSYADNLRKEVGNLEYEAERIRHAAEGAENNLRSIHGWVPEFLASAEKALIEAGDLLGEFEKASKTCCHGTLPDPSCRYQFSRKANHKTNDIKNLILENSKREISFSGPAPGDVAALIRAEREGKDVVQSTTTAVSASSVDFESRALMMRNIMDALVDNRYSVVGVHGMGGIGKSTLLVDAEKRIREKNSFDWVAKADVSQDPDVKKIQEEIAHWLGLNDIKKEDNVSLRAKLLRERLEDLERKKNKVLIILDNLWEQLDLKVLGIPCGLDNKVIGCKLLLTSRFRDVLQRDMACDRDFLLDGLQKEEAKKLFERIVGDQVHVDKFKPLVAEALHKCAGLPFLIVNLAKCFKHAGLPEWKNALKQIGLSKNEGLGEMINNMLQSSYDHLKDVEKSLLALCVACGTSNPSLENLVRYSVGWGLFQDDNMEDARDSLRSLIRTLQASSFLLEDGDDYGFKIHDLVREFVATIASRDRPLLVLKDQDKSIIELPKDKLKSCESICFPYTDMKKLPQELDCPELRFFLLFTNNRSIEVPDSLFNSMRKLMVLNLTGIHLTCSPSPFQFLKNLYTLCLDNCSLDNVSILGELKRLQILSFVNSKIQRLPKEIGQLVELRLLDLNYCSKLQIIEPGVLQNLIKLEELYMKNSFNQWNVMEQTPPTNANMIELNDMKYLKTLHISILNPSVLPRDLKVEKLTKYEIEMGNVSWWNLEGSRILILEWDATSEILQKGCIQSILGKTDTLILNGLNGIEQSICALSRKGFPELKHLYVVNIPSIHYILQSPFHIYFLALESLQLEDLINLEKICTNNISSKSFSALKVVQVEICHKMEVLFPLSSIRELPQLEKIGIVNCMVMRGILEADESGKFELCNLHALKLCYLPKIKNFCTTRLAPSSSTSDDLVATQIAFFNGQQVAFQILGTLEIIGLDSLEFIFLPSMVKSLTQLKELTISDCEKTEAIIMEEEGFGMETSEIFAFPMLTDLRLQRLKSLRCFSRGKCARESRSQDCVNSCATALFNHEVAFPNLEKLYIKGMDNIEMIWRDQIPADSFSKLKLLSVKECKKLVNVVPSFILGRLSSLETLMAKACDSLEVVFKLQPLNHLDRNSVATNLVKLIELRISKCEILTEVISDERGKEGHVVAFNQLKYMELDELTRLRCFSSGGYSLMFPLLEDIIVNRCPKMKFFFEGLMEAPKLERVRAVLNEVSRETKYLYFWKGNLNMTIQNMFEEMVAFAESKFMRLFEVPELIRKWHDKLNPVTSSWQLNSLVVDKCPSFINAIPSSLMFVLKRMRILQVHDCEPLEEIFDLEGLKAMGHNWLLPQLEYLHLVNLPKLRQLWNRDLQGTMYFTSLKYLSLYKCSNLRHAVVPSMARCLPNLSQIKIKECDQMEGVIVDEEGQGSIGEEITFLYLELITLECLPNLTSFLSWKNHMLECPILLKLSIAHCPKMRSLTWQSSMEIDNGTPSLFTPQVQFPRLTRMHLSHMDNLSKIWTDGPQETVTFDYLREVEVRNCKSLENLFPYWVATSLTQLKKIQVESCEIKEIVFSRDDTPHSHTTQDLFPKLTSLALHDMRQLKSFCPNLPTLNWPSLKELRVTHCDKLNMLSFPASMNSWAQRDDQQDLSDQEAHSSFERDFPNFKRLLLVNKNIQMIEDGNFPDDIFSKPKALTVACFHDEKAVFPSIFLLERFQNLQSLEVFCSSFESIFLDEGLLEEGKHPVLENLREIKLNKLHNLKHVWREDSLVSKILQRIETFEIWDCPYLTTIFPTVASFQNLTKLVVKNSSGLVHLVAVSTVTNLMHLEWMTIIGCEKMKEVVVIDENREGKVISFGNLYYLTLKDLPSLECFSSILSCTFKFPRLCGIEVEECPKMKTFSKGTLSTPHLGWWGNSVSLFRYKWEGNWEKGDDLNTTIQKLSA